MQEQDGSYKEMTKKVGGQSMPSETYPEEPEINKYEESRKSFMGKNGFDQSGMKGGR